MKKVLMVLLLALTVLTVFDGCSSQAFPALKTPDQVSAEEKHDQTSNYFGNATGTFVLRDLGNNTTLMINEKQAEKPLSPMTEFDIANRLIGLETGVVQSEKDPVALARQIGQERMKLYVDKISYGNKDISGGIDKFWVSGTLKTSALEQTDFIAKLYNEQLPFRSDVMKTVKKMLVLKQQGNVTLAGKAGGNSGKLGWFVGYVVNGKKAYAFACNLEGASDVSGAKAELIAEGILRDMHLLSASK